MATRPGGRTAHITAVCFGHSGDQGKPNWGPDAAIKCTSKTYTCHVADKDPETVPLNNTEVHASIRALS